MNRVVACMLMLLLATPCHAGEFKASGNRDPNHVGETWESWVTVTFETMPTTLRFLPGQVFFVMENGMMANNGWAETHAPESGGGCEAIFDPKCRYQRIWIESANDARITVRWRGALLSQDGRIARQDAGKVCPYGPGDWWDEKYVIYPDGVYVRFVTIHTPVAAKTQTFFGEVKHETQELIVNSHKLGMGPADVINREALTLMKMDGSHKTVSYGPPYPARFMCSREELLSSFGEFSTANMFVLNTKSEYRSFTIGRDDATIAPYGPESEELPTGFQSWPANPGPKDGWAVGLAHLVTKTWYKRTPTTVSRIFLSGFTKSKTPHKEVVPLARSWLTAPDILARTKNGPMAQAGYSLSERAYWVDTKKVSMLQPALVKINASPERPVINPAFLVNNCQASRSKLKKTSISVNGRPMRVGKGCRTGHYEKLKVGGQDQEWNNVMVVWLEMSSTKPLLIKITP